MKMRIFIIDPILQDISNPAQHHIHLRKQFLDKIFSDGKKDFPLLSETLEISFIPYPFASPNCLNLLQDIGKFHFIHLGAIAGVRYCEEHRAEVWEANVDSIYRFFRNFKDSILSVLFASSSSVYGVHSNHSSGETDSNSSFPEGVYALTKLLGETVVRNFCQNSGIPGFCFRFFTVYGPFGRPDMAILKFTSQIQKNVPITLNGDGTQKRDFTHVNDVSNIILSSLEMSILSKSHPFTVLNIGNNDSHSINELINLLFTSFGFRVPISKRISFSCDVPLTNADTSSLSKFIQNANITRSLIPKFTPFNQTSVSEVVHHYVSAIPFQIVAVIATLPTKIRFNMLCERCIPSILAQSRKPERLLICFDASEQEIEANQSLNIHPNQTPDHPWISKSEIFTISSLFASSGIQIDILFNNTGYSGASSAWNFAVRKASDYFSDPSNVYLAICDDDDSWKPNHLESNLSTAKKNLSHLTWSGLIRHEPDKEPRKQSIPLKIAASDFLVGNPHIQGSNLFVRLDVFLNAGMFDVAMKSTTDRDLLIRICDLPFFSGHPVTDTWTVNHFASNDYERLSHSSERKTKAIDYFLYKYQPRMTSSQYSQFTQRASKFFNWIPFNQRPSESLQVETTATSGEKSVITTPPVRHLIIGIITDSHLRLYFKDMIQDMISSKFFNSQHFSKITVFILENGNRPQLSEPNLSMINYIESLTVPPHFNFEILTHEFISSFVLPNLPDWVGSGDDINSDPLVKIRRSIAATRTILQYCIGCFIRFSSTNFKNFKKPLVWILDDDKLFKYLTTSIDNSFMTEKTLDFSSFAQLLDRHMNTTNADSQERPAIIGYDTGAPPLPTLYVLQPQLLDIYFHLTALSHQKNNISTLSVPQLKESIDFASDNFTSFYHGLQIGDHIERPFWNPQFFGSEDDNISIHPWSNISTIPDGNSITRPLFIPKYCLSVPSSSISHHRGGNTLILEPESLFIANYSISISKDCQSRRSDFIWSILVNTFFNQMHSDPSLALFHNRTSKSLPKLESIIDTCFHDIVGFGVYSSLLSERHNSAIDIDILNFDFSLIQHYSHIRFQSLKCSLYRIVGLSLIISNLAETKPLPQNFSQFLTYFHDPQDIIASIQNKLDDIFTSRNDDHISTMNAPNSFFLNYSDTVGRILSHRMNPKKNHLTNISQTLTFHLISINSDSSPDLPSSNFTENGFAVPLPIIYHPEIKNINDLNQFSQTLTRNPKIREGTISHYILLINNNNYFSFSDFCPVLLFLSECNDLPLLFSLNDVFKTTTQTTMILFGLNVMLYSCLPKPTTEKDLVNLAISRFRFFYKSLISNQSNFGFVPRIRNRIKALLPGKQFSLVQLRPNVAILGSARSTPSLKQVISQISSEIQSRGYNLITGGQGGVMEDAARGFSQNLIRSDSTSSSGVSIGFLPGNHPLDGNQYSTTLIPTGMDNLRNCIVSNSDAVIVFPGSEGTLSEIFFACVLKRPIFLYDSGNLSFVKHFEGLRNNTNLFYFLEPRELFPLLEQHLHLNYLIRHSKIPPRYN